MTTKCEYFMCENNACMELTMNIGTHQRKERKVTRILCWQHGGKTIETGKIKPTIKLIPRT